MPAETPDSVATPAHLPSPLPSTATLLHRTQGAPGLLREAVQH